MGGEVDATLGKLDARAHSSTLSGETVEASSITINTANWLEESATQSAKASA